MKGIDILITYLNFCQDFGAMQGRKEGQEFRSFEVRGKLIALKNEENTLKKY